MNFQALQRRLCQIKEIAIIGRNVEINGVICHVMGIVRRDNDTLEMLILEYDEAYWEKLGISKIAKLADEPVELITNRIEQQDHRGLRPDLHFHGVEKVCIGDLELTAGGGGGSICDPRQWDTAVLFVQFLLSGWNPTGVDIIDVNKMYLTHLSFDGSYDAIPAFDSEAPIRFSIHPGCTRHLVELPVTLTVGGEYPDRLYFTDQESGVRHWVQINRVTLCDMWAEMSETFDDPRTEEKSSPEELAHRKAEFEEHFSEICPKGMCFAVIEYECEEDISLQFYSKRWLDAEPISSNSSMGFIVGPDDPTGKLGLKMKAVVIPEPIAQNTISIEAELFQFNQMGKPADIVIV